MLSRVGNPEPGSITALLFLREGVPLAVLHEFSWVAEVLSILLKPENILSKWTAPREGRIKKAKQNNSLGLEGI